MSYILDALRRADAERERGAVPGLHAQQLPTGGSLAAAPRRGRAGLVAGMALAGALIVVLAWKLVGGGAAATQPTPISPVLPLPAVAGPMQEAVPLSPIVASPAAPAITTATLASRSAGTVATPDVARPAAESLVATTSTAVPKPPSATAARLDAAPSASSGSRLYAQAELPDDVRRSLPTLAVGGASYSNDAASRMLILNGQVFHEGDAVAEGLVLRQIKLKAAVLSFRDYRFEITY